MDAATLRLDAWPGFSSFRYTARLLLKSPGFTITAVLILGFGVGLNTAIFRLVNAVILKPLPFPDPERLVVLFMPIQRDEYNGFDYPDYEDIRAAQHSFQELAIFNGGEMILTGRGAAEQIGGDFVSPEMFAISGHRFLLGRPFTSAEDKEGGPNIVVLGEKFWRTHFNADPGVIRVANPDDAQPTYQAYFPDAQGPWFNETLMLRSAGDPHDLIPAIRKLVASIDSDVLVSDTTTFDDLLAQRSATRRLGVFLVGLFSGSALLLSAVGLYAVLAYSVTQRKREIGVRIALGAQTANILRLVVRHGLKIAGAGLLIGIGAALVLTRLIQGVLYGVSGSDPLSLLAAVFVLGLAALLACLLPALKAARIDPIKTLRE